MLMTPLTNPRINLSSLEGIINVTISTGKKRRNTKNTIIVDSNGLCTTILYGATALINL
jgi:hypothetical protein